MPRTNYEDDHWWCSPLRWKQNTTLNFTLLNDFCSNFISVYLKFVPEHLMNNKSALVQIHINSSPRWVEWTSLFMFVGNTSSAMTTFIDAFRVNKCIKFYRIIAKIRTVAEFKSQKVQQNKIITIIISPVGANLRLSENNECITMTMPSKIRHEILWTRWNLTIQLNIWDYLLSNIHSSA